MVELTDRAVDALARSDAAARRFNPDARVRLAAGPSGDIVAVLTDRAEVDDTVVRHDASFEIFVAAGIDGLIDAGDHDALFLVRD